MPIYRIHDKTVLFIHVPKTGGTSVERFLGAHAQPALHDQMRRLLRPARHSALAPWVAMQHFHAGLLEAMFPPDFFDYAFMVVRNPVDRLVSEYGHAAALGRIDARLPFNAWARAVMSTARLAPYLSNNHFRPQAEFRCFDAEVFKFEAGLDAVMEAVARRLDIAPPRETPHERRSINPANAASDSTRAKIRKFYAQDFSSFGYP